VISQADLRKMNQLIEEKRRDVQKWRECVDGLESALKEKGHELSAALSKMADMEARLLSASRPDANSDSSRIESSSATQQSGLISICSYRKCANNCTSPCVNTNIRSVNRHPYVFKANGQLFLAVPVNYS
jgi:hypothetical protein